MAEILYGKPIAEGIREEIKKDVQAWKEKGINPKIAIILVGSDPASVHYANTKCKACDNLGFVHEMINLPEDSSESSILEIIDKLNKDKNVHGVMVELPLPKHLDTKKVTEYVAPAKDVDGVHPINRGLIMSGGRGLFPATPQSCIELIVRSGVEISGKHVVIVGRGDTVGKPLVFMILKHDATVTICHSKTKDMASHTKQADILIVAAGRAGLITADMVKEGAVVIDAGINEVDGKLFGDVDFAGVQEIASLISPVPGGVGVLTTALLLRNVLKGITIQQGEQA